MGIPRLRMLHVFPKSGEVRTTPRGISLSKAGTPGQPRLKGFNRCGQQDHLRHEEVLVGNKHDGKVDGVPCENKLIEKQ